MTGQICAVAVDAATYAIDKLYSYRVPDELREQVQIGTRVLVPFGFGRSVRTPANTSSSPWSRCWTTRRS
nr:hypothetical protein [uncultured Agathobaculum sp.]